MPDHKSKDGELNICPVTIRMGDTRALTRKDFIRQAQSTLKSLRKSAKETFPASSDEWFHNQIKDGFRLASTKEFTVLGTEEETLWKPYDHKKGGYFYRNVILTTDQKDQWGKSVFMVIEDLSLEEFWEEVERARMNEDVAVPNFTTHSLERIRKARNPEECEISQDYNPADSLVGPIFPEKQKEKPKRSKPWLNWTKLKAPGE